MIFKFRGKNNFSLSADFENRRAKERKMKKEIKLTFCFCVTILTYATDAKSVLDFFEDRDRILELENGSYLGSDLELSTDEILANDHLMDHKVMNIIDLFKIKTKNMESFKNILIINLK